MKHPLGVGMIQQWLRAYEAEPFLHLLKKSGVDFVEMHLSHRNWAQREEWLSTALQAGLAFTFHGPYHGNYQLAAFEDREGNTSRSLFLETFEKGAKITRKGGFTALVNLHGGASETVDKDIMFNKTATFLKWLINEKKRRAWPFRFVMELLPANHHKNKIGDNSADLLKLIEEVPEGIEGFCWDVGHYRRNELMGFDDTLSREFLRQVRHLHIHDIKDIKEDFDHCPLKYDAVPYADYLDLLRGQDFSIVLELNYKHTLSCGGDPQEALLDSINSLREARQPSI